MRESPAAGSGPIPVSWDPGPLRTVPLPRPGNPASFARQVSTLKEFATRPATKGRGSQRMHEAHIRTTTAAPEMWCLATISSRPSRRFALAFPLALSPLFTFPDRRRPSNGHPTHAADRLTTTGTAPSRRRLHASREERSGRCPGVLFNGKQDADRCGPPRGNSGCGRERKSGRRI